MLISLRPDYALHAHSPLARYDNAPVERASTYARSKINPLIRPGMFACFSSARAPGEQFFFLFLAITPSSLCSLPLWSKTRFPLVSCCKNLFAWGRHVYFIFLKKMAMWLHENKITVQKKEMWGMF